MTQLGQWDKGGMRNYSGCDNSAVAKLPPEVLEQMIEGRISGQSSIGDMISWLHNDPEFGERYRHIGHSMLNNWFMRHGIASGRAGRWAPR